ncbi:MAG: twin-arginine translocation signal domain-containing protein [Rhizobiaceae bacterium]|nr:twin-arginine translocation signal domain-containing protein [Rhizobiaceae bacterium]
MERREFLTGLFAIAGVATIAGVVRPAEAIAGMPVAQPGPGILDELDDAVFDPVEGVPSPEEVNHRRRHWRRHHRHHRRHRRRVWRRVCRRYWRDGRWRRRCWRERVWIYV